MLNTFSVLTKAICQQLAISSTQCLGGLPLDGSVFGHGLSLVLFLQARCFNFQVVKFLFQSRLK